ncbi:aminotransferase class IV [Agrococcus carbonis]|uniref:Branched-chain amino acid aminotransferase/4-amino-4-deoxychorismate lyase n=1 Tax=Agrococcus carbonis TaxID=684552 RepID=A0A1H1L3Z3_9MICO|nr:aminotransferase class IV [Agrococcus carbonis]SDR69050.1 Branched-chain amino acid aminotransferase/4-amino-4-deoxychorismate lyase [Agrococcus carbonis]
MSGSDDVRAWAHGRFEPTREPVAGTVAADSWLVEDGLVLALDRHRLRFADAVADAGGDRADALSAARRAMREVPTAGRWSPRLDLTPGGIRLRVRPVPAAGETATVVTARRDPRTTPLRKGPDLEALGALQAEESARAGTAVEPVILDGGAVAEGTWSALLWWRGDALHVPAADIPRLPSVTAAVIAEVARIDRVELREERATPADLEGCEVWLANALRGIRTVERWIDGPRLAEPTRASAWRERLAGLRARPAEGGR